MNIIIILLTSATCISIIGCMYMYIQLRKLGVLYDNLMAKSKDVLDQWKISIQIGNEAIDKCLEYQEVIKQQNDYIHKKKPESTDDSDWWKKQ